MVAEYICDVSARLIVNIASLKLRKAEIEPLIARIERLSGRGGNGMIPIVRADGAAEWELLASLRRRSGEVDRKVTAAVTEIVDAVRERGDEAVREYTDPI